MKYMGSKNRIAKDILPIILKDRIKGQAFVDVFCGGCNLIDKVDGYRIANDNNKYLISMWRGLQKGEKRPYKINKDVYSCARDLFRGRKTDSKYKPKMNDFLIGWIGWMASYNGRFFDGGYSGHNVGSKNRDYISEQIRNTEKQIDDIKGISFNYGDYKELEIPKNSIIYCDPPYKGTKKYSTSKDFDYDSFWEWCRNKSKEGHRVYISEYSAPDDFKVVWQKQVTNSMNQTKTKKPIEKLFIPNI